MDRSQNFARSVGKEEMQTICECLRVAVSSLSNFFMVKIDAPRLKALLFEPLNQDKPMIDPSQKNAKRKRVNPNKTSNQKNAKRRKLHQDKPVTPVQSDAKKKKFDEDKPIAPPIQKDAKKKLDQDKQVAPRIQKDAKKSTLRPDSGNSHVQQKKSKVTVQTVHPACGSRPPTVFVPPQLHQSVPIQPSTQLPHIPQQLFNHSLFAHGLPRPQLHPVYHPHQGLLSQPQGNLVHFNHGIQLQHQGQAMFDPSASHHPVMDRLHPYGISGAQQMQHYDNRFVQRPPDGSHPSFWR
jgi:hypothetical protein